MQRTLILMQAGSWREAAYALKSARDTASSSTSLSFGLCLLEEPDEEELAEMRGFLPLQFIVDTISLREAIPMLWQGESHILMGSPAMEFSRHWDSRLLRILRHLPETRLEGSVLTGWLPEPADAVDAVSPVAADGFDEDGMLHFRRGTPLRYAAQPTVSAFLHPRFCFGPAGFFRQISEGTLPVFLEAYRRQWAIWTLHQPVIRLRWPVPVPPLLLQSPEDPDLLKRFGDWYGLDPENRKLSAQARLGVFSSDLSFPMQVPAAVKTQEWFRRITCRENTVSPLFVSQWITLPETGSLPDESLRRFSFLTAIEEINLLCYTDSAMASRAMQLTANILTYKSRYGFPARGDQEAETSRLNLLKLGKPFLLAHSRDKFLRHTHYVWIDFDYLRYPVYHRASMDRLTFCTEKILLSTVGGRPDTSMISIPEPMLSQTCQWFQEQYGSLRILPSETEAWTEMLRKNPDWFYTLELPQRRALLELSFLPRGEEFGTRRI